MLSRLSTWVNIPLGANILKGFTSFLSTQLLFRNPAKLNWHLKKLQVVLPSSTGWKRIFFRCQLACGSATAPALVFHDGSDQIPWAPGPGKKLQWKEVRKKIWTHQKMIKIGGFVVSIWKYIYIDRDRCEQYVDKLGFTVWEWWAKQATTVVRYSGFTGNFSKISTRWNAFGQEEFDTGWFARLAWSGASWFATTEV